VANAAISVSATSIGLVSSIQSTVSLQGGVVREPGIKIIAKLSRSKPFGSMPGSALTGGLSAGAWSQPLWRTPIRLASHHHTPMTPSETGSIAMNEMCLHSKAFVVDAMLTRMMEVKLRPML